MNSKILIGSDEGLYTVANGARTITITGLSWTLTTEQLAFIFNKTQNLLYYAPAPDLALCTLAAGVITIDLTFPVLVTGDIIHIQVWKPNEGFDITLDTSKVTVQNPQYGHYTSVETLVSESAWPGLTATTDETGDATHIIDSAAPFTQAQIGLAGGNVGLIGHKVYNITDSTWANVLSWDSTTTIHTTGGTVVSWATDEYKIPVAKTYEINMEGYNFLTIHYRLTADLHTTYHLKIYGTLDSTAVVDSTVNWVHLSEALLGSSSGIVADGITAGAIVVKEDLVVLDTPSTMLKYMVKIIAEGNAAAASGSSATVYVKKSS